MSAFVLVADNDPFNLRLLEAACREAGHSVAVASSDNEVLATVARQRPHLIVLDDKLPAKGGLHVLTVLQSDSNLRTIPVLVVTDEHDEATREHAHKLGASDFITRPYRVFDIQNRVRNALRSSRAQRTAISGATIPPAAIIDPVTGTGTPPQLLLAIDYEHTRAARYNHALTCIVVRLINAAQLKQHDVATANIILAELGNSISACIRGVDHLFRTRRDEFCILLPETDSEGAAIVLQRLKQRVIESPTWPVHSGVKPDVRVAVAYAPDAKISSGEALLEAARSAVASG